MKKAEAKNAELEIGSDPTPCANRMAHRNRPIDLSIGRITKEVPGRTLATFGSAWVLEWPPELMEGIDYQATTYRAKTTSQTFLVTTSQVLINSDVTSPAACQADFLRVNVFSTKSFRLNKVPLHEVQISGQTDHSISLTLIPTEPLHNQRLLSWIVRNEFQVDRPQVCDTCKKSDILEDGPDMLYCYVMCENPDKSFCLKYYVMEKDNKGLFCLQRNGNKTRLRSLQDFDRTEYPSGSIILNKRGVVGFLAFDKNDEILPLFLPLSRAVDGHFIELAPSRSEDTEVDREVRRKFNTFLNPAANESQDESDDSQIRAPSHSEMEDSHEDSRSTKNVKLRGNKNQPSEVPDFEPVQAADRYQEGRNRDCLKGDQHGVPAKETLRCLRQRRQSEKNFTPPKTARMLRKYNSEEPILPLKSGDLVRKVIYRNVYVMDTLARCLDTSYKNVQYWLHLAYLRRVPEDIILALKHGSPESRSEELFQVVSTRDPTLSIATLIAHLEELDMNDVVELCIQDANLNENRHMRVDKVLESGVVPGRFYTLLDQKPEEKWNELGMYLGLDGPTLKEIKIHCANRKENPAENVIELLCAGKPTMTIGQFKKHLENAKRMDAREKLDSLPAKKYVTIMDVRDDLNLTRQLSSMLNDRDKPGTYKDVAHECGIAPEIYRSLQPPCTESPTEEVMKDILGRNPWYTIDELFTDLRDMDRVDAVEMICRHFKEEDTRVLKRELQISDE